MSTLSTSDTNVHQLFQTQQPPPRNYDPPLLPPQNSTQTTSHNFPQQCFSDTNGTNTSHVEHELQFQTTTQPKQLVLQTLSYTQKIQPGLTIKTLHSNNHLTILPLEIFLDLHYKLFLIAQYYTVLRVQIPKTHNTLRQLIFNKTILILSPHLTHKIYHKI